jgi:hypothetical protein
LFQEEHCEVIEIRVNSQSGLTLNPEVHLSTRIKKMMMNKGPSWQNIIPVNAQKGYTLTYDKSPSRKIFKKAHAGKS